MTDKEKNDVTNTLASTRGPLTEQEANRFYDVAVRAGRLADVSPLVVAGWLLKPVASGRFTFQLMETMELAGINTVGMVAEHQATSTEEVYAQLRRGEITDELLLDALDAQLPPLP